MKKNNLILSAFFGMLFAFFITSCEKPHVHNLVEHEGKEATCEEDGYEAYVECTTCDYTTYKKIEKKGHDYKATKDFDGEYHYFECQLCHYKSEKQEHIMTKKVVEEATCSATGIDLYSCTECDYEYTAPSKMKEHTPGEWSDPEKSGEHLYSYKRCVNCNEILDEKMINVYIPEEVLNANEEINLLIYVEGQEGKLKDIGNYSNDIEDNTKKYHPRDIQTPEMARWFAAASAFKKIAPNVKINLMYTPISTYNSMIGDYKGAYGHLPELMWGVDHVVTMLQEGFCTDLSEYASSEYYHAYNEYFMTRFNFGNFQAAFPLSVDPWGVFVNLDILEDAANPVVSDVFKDGYCTNEYKEWVDNLTIDTFTDAVKKTNNEKHAGLSKVVEYFTSYAMSSINESFIKDGKVDLTSDAVKEKLQHMLEKENELSQYCAYVYDENSTGVKTKNGYNVQSWNSAKDFALDHECTFFAEAPWSLSMISQYINSATVYSYDGLPAIDDNGNYIPDIKARNTKIDYLPYPKVDANSEAYTGVAVEGLVVGNQFRMENGKKVPTQRNAKLKQDIAAYFAMFSSLDPYAINERKEIKYEANGQKMVGSLTLPLIKQNYNFSWQDSELLNGFNDIWAYQLSEWLKLNKLYITNDEEPDLVNFTNITYGLVKMLDSIYALKNVGDESDNYVRCLNYWNEPVEIEKDGRVMNVFDRWQNRFTIYRPNVIGTNTYVSTIMKNLKEIENYINDNSNEAWLYLSNNVNTLYCDENGNPLYPDITNRNIRNHYEGSRYN